MSDYFCTFCGCRHEPLAHVTRTTSPTAAGDVTEEMISELQRRVIEDTGCFVRKAWASETLEGILAMRAVSRQDLGGISGSSSLRSPESVPVSAHSGDDPGREGEAQ